MYRWWYKGLTSHAARPVSGMQHACTKHSHPCCKLPKSHTLVNISTKHKGPVTNGITAINLIVPSGADLTSP